MGSPLRQLPVTPDGQAGDMARCIDCNREMHIALGCVLDELTLDGVVYERDAFGYERGWPSEHEHCGDCGASRGHHHHLGCDIARCPACHGQLLSCGCPFEEYTPEERALMTGG